MMDSPRPLRRFGQNFLVDRSAPARITEALAPGSESAVLEIGPGRGALTAALLERLPKLAAVELDRRLAAELRARFPRERLVLFEQDVRRLDLSEVPPALGRPPETPLWMVGNLPYNISKPVALRMVQERARVERAVLMFQREVAERLTARVGQRAYGALTVLAGTFFRIRTLFDLPPGAFRPRPAVTSSVTSWERRARPGTAGSGTDAADERALRRCLAAAFARPRRTLFNNLRAALGDATAAGALLSNAGIDGRKRPAELSPEAYHTLARGWTRL